MKKLIIAALAVAFTIGAINTPAFAGGRDRNVKDCEELLARYYKRLGTNHEVPYPSECD